MEKQYKVIALSVGGLGNKIFNAGDVVNSANFLSGRADELCDQGFLEELHENHEEDKKKKK